MKNLLLGIAVATLLSSCTVNRNSMREANYQLWLHHEDLEYSKHLSGSSKQTKILFIDWQRTFGKQNWNFGGFGNLPNNMINSGVNANVNASSMATSDVAGSTIMATINGIIGVSDFNRVEEMAMYNLILQNPGYDIVMFPQFAAQRKWFGIGSKTEVVCTAKLARLKDTRP